MNNRHRKTGEQPWGYAEGFIAAGGVAFAGLLLQIINRNIDPAAFAWPVNVILGIAFVAGIICAHIFGRNNRLIRWLSSVRASVPAIAVLLFVVIIMGLTPQFAGHVPEAHLPRNAVGLLGWYRMTTSWMFALVCLYLLFLLGLTMLRRTRSRASWRDIGFYLNHAGLFLALFGGMLEGGDMERLTMTVREGATEWRASDKAGNVRQLPLAIELDTFTIEEYPPKLVVIDNRTGKMLPEGRPDTYLFDGIGKTASLAGNTVEILEYLPDAAIVRDSSIVNVVPMKTEGAAVAIKVRVTNPSLPQPVEGWVSNGSYLFPYHVLYIDEATSVAMPMQEVKRYTSKVTVFTEKGHTKKAAIEVNKPLSVEDWMIYQYSYDEKMGKYSDTSVFELIRDPWLKVVYTGIFMLLAGALFLFFAAPKGDGGEILRDGGDRETERGRRQRDKETRRRRDKGTEGQGDRETGRPGDNGTSSDNAAGDKHSAR
ncbi:MAG TPA: hypothetical protein DDW85_09590 [Porphyromonadaceae bacterium]|nr:hypothetical protein [Porphyromonadaceae bacterium]